MDTSDEHPVLYHYTSFQGVNAILESQTLWATHHKYLNDFQEGSLFRDHFVNLLRPFVETAIDARCRESNAISRFVEKHGGLDQIAQREAEVIVDAYHNKYVRNIYVTSFCGTPSDELTRRAGLLSQWRAYGPDGGCALVLDSKKLEKMLQAEPRDYLYMAGSLLSVVYSHEAEYPSDFVEDLMVLAHNATAIFEANAEGRQEHVTLESFGPFVRSMTRFKHWGFREEQEVRAALLPGSFSYFDDKEIAENELTQKSEKAVKYRTKAGTDVPYIELFENLEEPLPIQRIIVGPHKDKEARVAQLREKLSSTDIEVDASEIPYIG